MPIKADTLVAVTQRGLGLGHRMRLKEPNGNFRVCFPVEAFLLQDQGWDAAFEERRPQVMCSRDDAKNAHDVVALVDACYMPATS